MENEYIKFRKSRVVMPGQGINGGPKGAYAVTPGMKHDILPRLRKAQLDAGVDRMFKLFFCYEDPNGDPVTDFEMYMKMPSTGDDAQLLALAEHDETQADFESEPSVWVGSGSLDTDPNGNTAVVLSMESTEAQFVPGGYLYLSDSFMTGQTIDDGSIAGRPAVKIGDSVEWITDSWRKADHDDYEYPNGYYLGAGVVLTLQSSSKEAFLQLDEKQTTLGALGTGDGTTQPTLSDLDTHTTNGLVVAKGYKPVLTVIDSSDSLMTIYIEHDGTCSGDCTGGEIDLDTAIWITQPTWTAAPKNTENIQIVFYDKNYSYSGSTCTVELAEACPESFTPATTYGGGVLRVDMIQSEWEDESVTSTSGTFDSTSGNLVLNPGGAEDDIVTITFSTSIAFACAGAYIGSMGTGVITSDFEPINPDTGYKYFTLKSDAWSGSWVAGDTVSFHMRPQAQGFWMRQIAAIGATEAANNFSLPEFWGA